MGGQPYFTSETAQQVTTRVELVLKEPLVSIPATQAHYRFMDKLLKEVEDAGGSSINLPREGLSAETLADLNEWKRELHAKPARMEQNIEKFMDEFAEEMTPAAQTFLRNYLRERFS